MLRSHRTRKTGKSALKSFLFRCLRRCTLQSLVIGLTLAWIVFALTIPSPSPSFEGIPEFQQIRALSSGSFGQVHHVRMTNIWSPGNPDAALKVFNQGEEERVNKLDCKTETAMLRVIADYEASSGQKLQISHLRTDIPSYPLAIFLEYIPGSDLSGSRFRGYSMSRLVAFLQSMMHQISGEALKGLHSANIYHGDIKPANILYDSSKEMFFLIDFGLAIPLSLLDRPEFRRQSFFTTLPFTGPQHLEIMNRSRVSQEWGRRSGVLYYGDQSYHHTDNSDMRRMAKNAEYYSLALSTLRILGRNCAADEDPLCEMGRRVRKLQDDIPSDAIQEHVFWTTQKIEELLRPYWAAVEKEVRAFREKYPERDTEFMQLLNDWLLPAL